MFCAETVENDITVNAKSDKICNSKIDGHIKTPLNINDNDTRVSLNNSELIIVALSK